MVVSCILPHRALTRRQSANDDSSYTRHIAEPPRHPSHHHVGLAGWLAGRTVTHGTHGVVSSQCFSLSRQSVGAAQRSLDDYDNVCCPMMDHEPSASPERATGRGPVRRRVRKRAETARPARLAGGRECRSRLCLSGTSVNEEGNRRRLAGLLGLVTPVLPASSSPSRVEIGRAVWSLSATDVGRVGWACWLLSFAVLVAAAPERGREGRPWSGCRCAGTVVQVEEWDMAPRCITTTTALVDE